MPDANVAVSWSFGVVSDRGKRRPRNEDAVLALPDAGLYAVADGMGGHAGGEIASGLAIRALATLAAEGDRSAAGLEARLRAGFAGAFAAIRAAAADAPELGEMGTTLTALAIEATGGTALIGHIGDSRAYLMRGTVMRRLTRDDTWVQDQVDAGFLKPRAALRHPHSAVLTRVIGATDAQEPALIGVTLARGDTLLLCTDGLNGMLRPVEISARLADPAHPERIAMSLVDEANRRGGHDNVTVVVLRAT